VHQLRHKKYSRIYLRISPGGSSMIIMQYVLITVDPKFLMAKKMVKKNIKSI